MPELALNIDNPARTMRAQPADASLLPLSVRNLSFSSGNMPLIRGLSMDISAGGVTAIMGPNGAGKSLLVRLLHGLIQPDAGEIFWNGVELSHAVRVRQAMVFQRPVLLRRSVGANIAFVLKLNGRPDPGRVEQLLSDAGLAERARQPARLLSGGEQQRLALARALASCPDVLFLDEPTVSLDPASQAKIEGIVQRAQTGGVKVILVTHDVGQARRLARDVAFLHRGRLLEHTSAERFFSGPETSRAQAYLDGKIVL